MNSRIEKSRKLNRTQFDILIKRMRQNPEMAQGIVKDNRDRVRKFWHLLSEELNRAGPPEKNVAEWRKAWTDRRRYERRHMSSSASFTTAEIDEGSYEDTQDISFVVNEAEEPTEVKYSSPQRSSINDQHSSSSNQSFPEQFTRPQPALSFNDTADPLTPQKSENADSTQFLLKRLHLSLEHLCYQKQMQLDESKRHNMQMELLAQEKIAIKSRLLQLKEENLRLLRQSMGKEKH